MKKSYRSAARVLAGAAFVAGCNSHSEQPERTKPVADASVAAASGSADASATTTAVSDAGNGNTAPPILVIDGGSAARGGTGSDGSAVCAAEAHQAEAFKLDLLVLMDGSGSMKDEVDAGVRKWDLLVDALREFVNDPKSAGIGIGLTYFGIPAGYDAGDLVVSCDAGEYAKPAVAVGDLPRNASAIVSSLSQFTPVGGTPTRPALGGAETYAKQWLAAHPGHRAVVVLATDGIPNDCDSTVDSVSLVAAAGSKTTPGVPVYVIGVGNDLASLNQIAAAGGTAHAYLVDPSSDTTQSFLSAMNAIRGLSTLPCEYTIPEAEAGKEVDLGKVNVAFTGGDAGSALRTLAQVTGASACAGTENGWYYDDPAAPKSIELCPAACTRAKSDPTGRVDVLVGCKTQFAAPR